MRSIFSPQLGRVVFHGNAKCEKRPLRGRGNYGYGVFWILNVVYDIGGLSHALGSVTAVSDGVLLCYHLYRRFRRCAAAPPSIHLVALRALKFGEPAVRGKTMGASERMRAEFSSPQGGSR